MESTTAGGTKTSSKKVKEAKEKRAKGTKPATPEQVAKRKKDRLREPLIDKALEDNDLQRDGTVVEKARRLDDHYRNTTPVVNGLDCDCGYFSPADTPSCPFCGDSEVLPTTITAPGATTAAKPDGSLRAEPIAGAEGTSIERADAAYDEPPASEADRDVSAEKLVRLDEQCAKVREAHESAVASYWDLGSALAPICDGQLYFQRRDETGAPIYRSFAQFVATEFAGVITIGHAYRVMTVAKRFDRKTAVEIGVAKMGQLARVKAEKLPEMIERARDPSVTVRTLSQEIRPHVDEPGGGAREEPSGRSGRGSTAGSRQALAAGRDAAAFAASKAENRITVSTALGETVVALFCKADPKRRAKRLADEPAGEEVTVNGVAFRYFVELGADGGLQLKIVRTRATT